MTHETHPFDPNLSNTSPNRGSVLHPLLCLFLITLLAIPILQPLLTTAISCGFDTVFHLWRSVQAGALLENGVIFSRWAPHMAHGYGYPLFMFQSPLSAQITAVFHLAGLSWPIALNVVYGLGILASGWTMWWLARTFWGDWGGLLASVAYLYTPFHLYVAFYRASLSETVAWSLPPLVLWGLYQWQVGTRRRGLVTAVFSFVLLVYTHDVTAYLFLPLFVGWILLWGVNGRSWQAMWHGILALLLGIGGSAFFWLPAMIERSAIQFDRANSAWPFLYFNNYLPLEQLLALPRNADPSLLNDWPPRGLGGLILAAALLGGLVAWRRRKSHRWLIGFLLLVLAAYIFITSSISEPLWAMIPPLAAFQFPWRFLAPASLAAAFLAGGLAHLPAQKQRRGQVQAIPHIAIGVLAIGHWGWLYPAACQAPGNLSLEGIVSWEVATATLGSTASGELLPSAVEIVPDPTNPPVWESRLDAMSLPAEATVLNTDYKPLKTTIELESAVPFQATLHIFNFPGWQVTVNNEPVPVTPADQEGWITFPVGDGRSTIEATFGETPLRWAADGISLLSLLLLLVVSIRYSVGGKPSNPRLSLITDHRSLITEYWPLFALALFLIIAKLFLVDAGYTPLRQSRLEGGELNGVAEAKQITLGAAGNPDQVRLLGLDAWETAVPADEPLTLHLYWQALQPLTANYKVGLTLLDENGNRWSNIGLRDYRWLRNPDPTTTWPTEQYAATAFFVDLLPGTPPGTYQLQLSFFEEQTLTPLTFYDAQGQPLGPQLELGLITVETPRKPWPTTLLMQHRLEVATSNLTLLGSNLDRSEAAPGDPLLVTLFWSAAEATSAQLSLMDAQDEAVANWPVEFPAYGQGTWRSQLPLRLPVSLTNGRYQWQLTFPNGQTVQWGELEITAPERLMEPPEIQTAVNQTLSEQATLVGFTLESSSLEPGGTADLELIWQAVMEMNESYRVFVHLLAEDGRIVAQADGLPANWARPTTGWLPGEFIRDSHTVNLPPELTPGDYTLVTGLYLPNSSRLQQADGSDVIILTEITVSP